MHMICPHDIREVFCALSKAHAFKISNDQEIGVSLNPGRIPCNIGYEPQQRDDCLIF